MSCTSVLLMNGGEERRESQSFVLSLQKGVRHLQELGIKTLPTKYILPPQDRPNLQNCPVSGEEFALNLPVIDFSLFHGPHRSQALASLSTACQNYGFFQLINHGIPSNVIDGVVKTSKDFFGMPFEERSKYMSADMHAPVRYGTSFNQTKDGVFCWRDFLKLSCHSLPGVLPSWPSSPSTLRECGVSYAEKTKSLYMDLMEAIIESLGVEKQEQSTEYLKESENGSHILVMNCYPTCPEPDLTLGMPAHSDYGFLTLLLQDEHVQGLQIHRDGKWLSVQPTPRNSFIVNVGDHLEIFSNGRYKSVLHRVLTNPSSTRISVASLHSWSFGSIVKPCSTLIDENNPRRFKDTDYSNFLDFVTSGNHKGKNFLESRKIDAHSNHNASTTQKI